MELEQKNKNDVANKKKKKIVMTWKIVGAPKASVIYIYIYIDYRKFYTKIEHLLNIKNTHKYWHSRRIYPQIIAENIVQIFGSGL